MPVRLGVAGLLWCMTIHNILPPYCLFIYNLSKLVAYIFIFCLLVRDA